MRIRITYMIQMSLWIIALFASLIASLVEIDVFFYIAVVALTLFFIVRIFFWRCPYCKKNLGKGIKYSCPHCGKNLE